MLLLFHFKYFSPGVRTLLRAMADDFSCQVKQIISDFKAAERIVGDISVGTEPVPYLSSASLSRAGKQSTVPHLIFGKVEICLQIALEKWR